MTHVLSAVAWPYANGPRHIGHVAGFGVPSDVFSRYMRMAGHDVLMVSGTDEHGTPILVAADQEGVTAARAGRQEQRGDRQRPRRPRAVLRPVHPHDHRQPLQGRAGALPARAPQRLPGRADDVRRDQPVDRAHPARPLHRGHLPDLRLPRRARRPVRQLRQPARPDRPDRPAVEDQRRDAGVRRDPALLPRPARARRRADGVPGGARGVRHLAAQRHQVLPEPGRGPPAAGDDPRHRLGHPGADRRLARAARPSGSTSGSTRSSATCPRRSSGPRPRSAGTPTAGASGGTTPRRSPTTSWARTTSSSTPRSGPPS